MQITRVRLDAARLVDIPRPAHLRNDLVSSPLIRRGQEHELDPTESRRDGSGSSEDAAGSDSQGRVCRFGDGVARIALARSGWRRCWEGHRWGSFRSFLVRSLSPMNEDSTDETRQHSIPTRTQGVFRNDVQDQALLGTRSGRRGQGECSRGGWGRGDGGVRAQLCWDGVRQYFETNVSHLRSSEGYSISADAGSIRRG